MPLLISPISNSHLISTIELTRGLYGGIVAFFAILVWVYNNLRFYPAGYHARMRGVDLALIMHKPNHETIAYIKRYLGITDDELQAVVERLNL